MFYIRQSYRPHLSFSAHVSQASAFSMVSSGHTGTSLVSTKCESELLLTPKPTSCDSRHIVCREIIQTLLGSLSVLVNTNKLELIHALLARTYLMSNFRHGNTQSVLMYNGRYAICHPIALVIVQQDSMLNFYPSKAPGFIPTPFIEVACGLLIPFSFHHKTSHPRSSQ